MKLKDKKIVVGVTGGIAAYKIAYLVRLLKKAGADVHVMMTAKAQAFIGKVTLQALSGHPVLTETLEPLSENGIDHINIVADADLVIIAPATANTLAKIRLGLADNILTSATLAAPCPILLAPAMNKHMLENPATVENITILKERGYAIVGPDNGFQACGENGSGRMSEPEEILTATVKLLIKDSNLPLAGKKVIITAGPTVENIDPVRFICNKSSGKMGYALAKAAKDAGGEVILISGPVNIEPPKNVTLVPITSANDMLEAVKNYLEGTSLFIACAAVADFRMQEIAPQKIKKEPGTDTITLTLVKNPDILALTGHDPKRPKVVVGFAAETTNVEANALKKLESKGADYIVANDVSVAGLGFGSEQNKVCVYAKDAEKVEFGPASKLEIGHALIEIFSAKLNHLS